MHIFAEHTQILRKSTFLLCLELKLQFQIRTEPLGNFYSLFPLCYTFIVFSLSEKLDELLILTFDEFGISSHPNHIDTHYGAMEFAKAVKGKTVCFIHHDVFKLTKLFFYNNSNTSIF